MTNLRFNKTPIPHAGKQKPHCSVTFSIESIQGNRRDNRVSILAVKRTKFCWLSSGLWGETAVFQYAKDPFWRKPTIDIQCCIQFAFRLAEWRESRMFSAFWSKTSLSAMDDGFPWIPFRKSIFSIIDMNAIVRIPPSIPALPNA